MTKPRVYVTRKVPQFGIDLLLAQCEVKVWDNEEVVPRQVLLEGVRGVDAIFCTISDNIDKEVLDAAGPNLKTVATMSVGTLHIDKFLCKERNIYVANTPDVAADSAAEMTVALLLITARRALEGNLAVKRGEWTLWKPMWLCGTEMSGRTLGIIGFGRVGFGVARRLKPFGIKRILYNDVSHNCMGDDLQAEFVDQATVFRESDFLVITCPLTGLTRKLINAKTLSMMKSTAILVNTSRGPVIDTDDLYKALVNKTIAAAGLDVTDPQPLPSSHPLVKLDNCIITPHLGTNSKQARVGMAENTAKNILAILFQSKR